MDLNALLSGIIENIIASLPQLAIVLSAVLYNLSKVRETANKFPKNLSVTETSISTLVTDTKEVLLTLFGEAQDTLVLSFDDAKKQMLNIVKDFAETLSKNISESLVGMKNELAFYHKDLIANANQSNLLVMENKLFMDTISILLAQDPIKIQNGIATMLAGRLNLAREELEKLPETLVMNLAALEQALKETALVSGQAALDTLMEKLGYVRDKIEQI